LGGLNLKLRERILTEPRPGGNETVKRKSSGTIGIMKLLSELTSKQKGKSAKNVIEMPVVNGSSWRLRKQPGGARGGAAESKSWFHLKKQPCAWTDYWALGPVGT